MTFYARAIAAIGPRPGSPEYPRRGRWAERRDARRTDGGSWFLCVTPARARPGQYSAPRRHGPVVVPPVWRQAASPRGRDGNRPAPAPGSSAPAAPRRDAKSRSWSNRESRESRAEYISCEAPNRAIRRDSTRPARSRLQGAGAALWPPSMVAHRQSRH